MTDLLQRAIDALMESDRDCDYPLIAELEASRAALSAQPEPAAPRFPTMLRKMWSGGEVQAWIDEHWPAAAPTVVEPGADGMPINTDERHLRRLLARRVGMPQAYYDDGEAQGTEHGIQIDFMREPVADIDAKLRALNAARYWSATPPRAALTNEQIKVGLTKLGGADLWQVVGSYFREGVRFAEQAHGISNSAVIAAVRGQR